MRLAAVVLVVVLGAALAACAGDGSPMPQGRRRGEALGGPGLHAAACYSGRTPADVAEAMADKLRIDGWTDVVVKPNAALTGRWNVSARRGDDALGASSEPGGGGTPSCDGAVLRVGVVAASGRDRQEIGPGGPAAHPRLSVVPLPK